LLDTRDLEGASVLLPKIEDVEEATHFICGFGHRKRAADLSRTSTINNSIINDEVSNNANSIM
jgi:hypothetical protein